MPPDPFLCHFFAEEIFSLPIIEDLASRNKNALLAEFNQNLEFQISNHLCTNLLVQDLKYKFFF